MKPFKLIMKKIFALNKKHSQDVFKTSIIRKEDVRKEDDLLDFILSNRKTIDSVRISDYKIITPKFENHFNVSFYVKNNSKNNSAFLSFWIVIPFETNFDDFLKRLVSFGKLHNFDIHRTIKYSILGGKEEEIWISNRLNI
jgi:hypothetical protein